MILCSLFTHHLRDPGIVSYLQWAERTAQVGWFVSDLHRHRLPYEIFRIWSRLAGWHEFVRNDGPISITRSFVRADWQRLIAEAGLNADDVGIAWHMPFRLCLARVR